MSFFRNLVEQRRIECKYLNIAACVRDIGTYRVRICKLDRSEGATLSYSMANSAADNNKPHLKMVANANILAETQQEAVRSHVRTSQTMSATTESEGPEDDRPEAPGRPAGRVPWALCITRGWAGGVVCVYM